MTGQTEKIQYIKMFKDIIAKEGIKGLYVGLVTYNYYYKLN